MAINNNYPIVSIVMVTILLTITLPRGVEAQSPASAPVPEMDPCLTPLLNMSDCLSFVATGSNDTKPAKECCPELAGLVESNPICLCTLLGGSDKLGLDLSIDVNRALQLPALCKVETPPVSTCAALGIPVAAPMESPTSPAASTALGIPVAAPMESPTSPAASPPPSPLGGIAPGVAAAGPSTNNGNGGSSLTITSLQCFVGLAFMIFSSFF